MPSGLFDKEWHQKKSVGKTYCYSEELDFYAKRQQQRKQTFLFNGTMHCILISYKFSILYHYYCTNVLYKCRMCIHYLTHTATREQHYHYNTA